MNFLVENQLLSIIGSFCLGSIVAALLYRYAQSSLSWRMADFIWVALGGVGAITALLSGTYLDENSRVNRQIDISYAISKNFDTMAERFKLLHCQFDRQGPGLREPTLVLCEKLRALTKSAVANQDLPLFLELTVPKIRLAGLNWLYPVQPGADATDTASQEKMAAQVANFDTAALLTVASNDWPAAQAWNRLNGSASAEVAVDYQVISETYEDLVATLGRVKAEWDYLQANSVVLILQVLALCLIAFAAPFRLGRSFTDL
jgi:hypothetical protein